MSNASNTSLNFLPIITIDGPSGAGKGTITAKLANHLGYQLLDSGALYRIVGLMASQANLLIEPLDENQLAHLTQSLDIQFLPSQKATGHVTVLVNGNDVSHDIRTEQVGEYASKVAVFPKVRNALLTLQKNMASDKGLIADGRDMGTVVFPQATVKVFLTASAQARANRRVKQLQQAGKTANYDEILTQIIARDERDSKRNVAPSKPADDAIVIDSSTLTIDEVFQHILQLCQDKSLI